MSAVAPEWPAFDAHGGHRSLRCSSRALYGLDPTLIPPGADRARVQDAAIPTWSTLTVGTGLDVYTPTTPGARVSGFKQRLYTACGMLRTTLTWTASDGKATDLVYDVIARRADPHVGAVRVQMTPRWSGKATVIDAPDGAGARRLVQTGGGAYRDDPTIDDAERRPPEGRCGIGSRRCDPGIEARAAAGHTPGSRA